MNIIWFREILIEKKNTHTHTATKINKTYITLFYTLYNVTQTWSWLVLWDLRSIEQIFLRLYVCLYMKRVTQCRSRKINFLYKWAAAGTWHSDNSLSSSISKYINPTMLRLLSEIQHWYNGDRGNVHEKKNASENTCRKRADT